MATIVNTHEAKTHLSKLLALVEQGEEVVIARNGKPVARLVPEAAPARRRQLGFAAGKVTIPDSFFDPLSEEELAAWYGDTRDSPE